MITRIKDTDNGNYLKLSLKVESDLFDVAKKESALTLKHMQDNGDVAIDVSEKVITEDERFEFELAKDDLILDIFQILKEYGLDRNDLVPIDNRDIYHYQTINDNESMGSESTIEGEDEILFHIVDNEKAGQNTLNLINNNIVKYAAYFILSDIMNRMSAPEIAKVYEGKTIIALEQLDKSLFYLL